MPKNDFLWERMAAKIKCIQSVDRLLKPQFSHEFIMINLKYSQKTKPWTFWRLRMVENRFLDKLALRDEGKCQNKVSSTLFVGGLHVRKDWSREDKTHPLALPGSSSIFVRSNWSEKNARSLNFWWSRKSKSRLQNTEAQFDGVSHFCFFGIKNKEKFPVSSSERESTIASYKGFTICPDKTTTSQMFNRLCTF